MGEQSGGERANSAYRLALLGGFRLSRGGELVLVSPGTERLLAYLALHPPVVRRALVAGTLWPNVPESHALASLRSALVRLDEASRAAIEVHALDLGLSSSTEVDLDEARAVARRVADSGLRAVDRDSPAATIAALSPELLPGWYEDWAVSEADEWRQVRLHALERLADHFADEGRFSAAASAATAAVRAEPLRESARAALVRVHLAEGNQFDALHEFRRYEDLLRREMGVKPTKRLHDLVAHLLPVTPP